MTDKRLASRERRRAQVAVIGVLAALVLGCAQASGPGPMSPAPAAGDVSARQVVARTADSVTMLPASPGGATVGRPYAYTMPMCGAGGPIDIDGSFWDVAGDGSGLDGQSGVFRLQTTDRAQFVAADGLTFTLHRHPGAKAFAICS